LLLHPALDCRVSASQQPLLEAPNTTAALAPLYSQASPAASSAAPETAPGLAHALSLVCVPAGLGLQAQLARLTAGAMAMVSGEMTG
jgi:hypothetical protein